MVVLCFLYEFVFFSFRTGELEEGGRGRERVGGVSLVRSTRLDARVFLLKLN